MSRLPETPRIAWDIWRAARIGEPAIASRQRARLADLVTFARERSPYYRRIYRGLPAYVGDPQLLPPVTKPELMEHFDEWVTDPALTRTGVEGFVGDPSLVGAPYLGRYAVWTTSGTTGTPAIFVHDPEAVAVYEALLVVRGLMRWMNLRRSLTTLLKGGRVAYVFATGGHFAAAALLERVRRRYPWSSSRLRALSVLSPLPELVSELNRYQPAILAGYSTAMGLLAQERAEGRLNVSPVLTFTGAEWVPHAELKRIESAFRCPLREVYGATEFLYAATGCGHGWLHANADWMVLEPVDEEYQPVPPGEPSHTALLTNLANRTQPIIRYDLGDSVTLSPDPCPCGSPLPAIRVEGRANDVLSFDGANGRIVKLLPLALVAVIEETPGVRRFQATKVAPKTLKVRLETKAGADPEKAWKAVERRLGEYLSAQGLAPVGIERDREQPRADPKSGKFRQVWAEAWAEA